MFYSLIPVETGIGLFRQLGRFRIPAGAGMAISKEIINLE
jgi:hypothetical protein